MKKLIILLCVLYSEICFAQLPNHNTIKNYGFNIQLNGLTKPYFELGIGKYSETSNPDIFAAGFYIASELKIDFKKTVLGPKVGVWASGGAAPISLGLSLIYYSDISDFSIGSFRLRPEIGYGLFNFRTYLGANIPITSYRVSKEYVNLMTVGIMWFIPVFKSSIE